MRRTLICLLLLFTATCQHSGPQRFAGGVPAAQVVSYPAHSEGQYVILSVQDNGVGPGASKKAAMHKAAEITVQNGYRYFSIVSEKDVRVAKTSEMQGSQQPGNLYQELIIEKDFGRKSLEQDGRVATRTYPAYRLTIECYREKPGFKKSYDAEQLLTLAPMNFCWDRIVQFKI